MITQDMRSNEEDPESASASGRALLERRTGVRKLLRQGMAQVQAAVMGAQLPIRSMVANVQVEFSRHLAEADALMPPGRGESPVARAGAGRLQAEFAGELGTLEALGAWPDDKDDLELALRFQELAPVLLEAMASEERYLLESARHDLAIEESLGC
jgi:hypothetical protein